MPEPINLTERQENLLRALADVYENGCQSEFLLVETLSKAPQLVYSGHPPVQIDADKSDFVRLEKESLVDLFLLRRGDTRGKPTAKGLAYNQYLLGRPAAIHHPAGRVRLSPSPGPLGPPGLTSATSPSPSPLTAPPGLSATKDAWQPSVRSETKRTTVFIGHGRSKDWMDLRDFIVRRLKLDHEEFNRESAAGLSVTERLSQILAASDFALLVLTGEDEHADGTRHARENVIHEVGLFQGKLGFQRAIVLLEEGCERFSNIAGLVYIGFPKGCIKAVFFDVQAVLEREKLL